LRYRREKKKFWPLFRKVLLGKKESEKKEEREVFREGEKATIIEILDRFKQRMRGLETSWEGQGSGEKDAEEEISAPAVPNFRKEGSIEERKSVMGR